MDAATQYANDVVAGKVTTGRLVRLACERHLRDLTEGLARGLWFDEAEAEAAIELWELCPHLKGKEAKRKETIRLEPWQRFIIGSVYGWKRFDRRRRFRVVWVEMGRKNGKSTTLYPAAIHGLTIDGEAGAEVYSVATKKDQARITFDLARRAIRQTPDLAAVLQTYAFSIVNEASFSKFEAVSSDADTLDGLNPSVALCDEIHKWRGRALWDVIETGMGAREQPLLWAITTAGEEGEQDVYGQEHNHTVQVLEGVVEDDSRFGYIASIDPEDDWTDPTCWVKANPNLGVSVDPDELAAQVRKAKQTPAAANAVLRLRLGRRTQDADAWIPLSVWDRGRDERVNLKAFAGFPCFGGLDLASSSDFAALSLLFPLTRDLQPAPDTQRPDVWAYVVRLWMPRDGASHRETKLREIAAPWASQGWVVQTEGDCIDHGRIEADILELAGRVNLIGIAYDPFNASMLATRLQGEGIDVAKFPQSMTCFSEPTKLFESDLLSGIVRHDGNPALRWMVNNTVLVSNAAGHRMPSRKKSRNKIDGVVAAVMARGRAMVGGGVTASYYDSNGVEAF